jgi:hypothetical protein
MQGARPSQNTQPILAHGLAVFSITWQTAIENVPSG